MKYWTVDIPYHSHRKHRASKCVTAMGFIWKLCSHSFPMQWIASAFLPINFPYIKMWKNWAPYQFHIFIQPSHTIPRYGSYMAHVLPYHSHTYFFFGKGTPPKRRNGIEKRRNRETQQHSDITKQRVENFAHNFTSKPKAPFRETIEVELLTALRLILIIYRVNDKISRETRTFQYSVPFQQYILVLRYDIPY